MKEQLEIKDLANYCKEEIIASLSRAPNPSVPDNGINIKLSIFTSIVKVDSLIKGLSSILILYKDDKQIDSYDLEELEEAIADYNKLLE